MDKLGVGARRWLPWPSPRNDFNTEEQPEDQQPPVVRQAFAEWGGGFKGGKGTVTMEGGGLLKLPCSLASQLAGTPGTDPEEVLAAVHAASFCMALVTELSASGIEPRSVHTTATVKVEKQAQSLDSSQLDLEVNAWIPGADRLEFARAADNAKSLWKRSLPFKGTLAISVNLHAW